MAAYLTLILAVVLAGCSLKSPPFDEWAAFRAQAAAYPETRSNRIDVRDIELPAPHSTPHAHNIILPAFGQRGAVLPNARIELDGLSVLYQAPNRHPERAEPYLPPAVADRVMIVIDGKPVVDQEILPGFTGTDGRRSLETARLRVNGNAYLLVVSRASASNPMWVGVFGAKGEVLYRAGLPHGVYHFIENRDGISFVDDAGFGKRIVMH